MRTSTSSKHRQHCWRVRALPAAIVLGLLAAGPAMAIGAVAAPGAQATATRSAGISAQDPQNPTQDQRDTKGEKKKPQTLGTINVTATGRVQSVISVPMNISVVSGATIEQQHIMDNAELFRTIPGVNLVDSDPRSSSVVNTIHIRGVNVDSSAMGDYALSSVAPVATYVDSVPLFANFLLFDINRVEVLRGPQGTLYGSGALSGTVRYLLNKPQLNQFNGSVSASLSNVKDSSGIGNSEAIVLNAPLGNKLAVRFDGMRNDYPGVTDYPNLYVLGANGHPVAPDGILSPVTQYYSKKDVDTAKQNFGRLSLLWKPNDAYEAQLSYMAQADRFGGRRGTSPGVNGFGEPYPRNSIGAVQLEPSNRHVNLTSLEQTLDLGFATLTSSTSHYNTLGDITSDSTGYYAQFDILQNFYYNYPRPMVTGDRTYGDKAFIQEFRLVSKSGGSFDYLLGLYYQNEHSFADQNNYFVGFKDWWDAAYPAFASAVLNDNQFYYRNAGAYRETALYGQGTWHASDSLQFTLGARAFRDRYTGNLDTHVSPYAAFYAASHSSSTQQTSKTIWMGNVSWWFNSSNQLYATISQGYRRGGSNAVPDVGRFAESPAWQFYRPDTVLNHEVGLKGLLGGLNYTADVFYTSWKNPQLNTVTTNFGFFAAQNMGRAETKGLELEVQGKAGDHFSYGAGYAYTDAKLTRDAFSPDGVTLIALKGMTLPGVSKNHLNAFGSYSAALGPGTLTLTLDSAYQSPTQNTIGTASLLAEQLGGFTIWNATASYNLNRWTAILWLKNLTDVQGITGVYPARYMGTAPAQHFFGNDSMMMGTLPRTIGFTAIYRF